jgi:glycosyltransferase 2 family protein
LRTIVTKTPWVKRALHATAAILTVIVIVALVRALQRDGPAALEVWRATNVRWTWVAIASACGLAGHAVYVMGWRRLLRDCGINATFWQAARFFLVSNLGRYLPGGKAWQMGIIGVMAAENGLPAAFVAATSLLQGVLGVAVGAILLLATAGAALGIARIWFVLPVAGVVALLAAPAALKSLPRVRSAVVRHMPTIESVSTATMWMLVWTAGVSWIAWGIALDSLARALLPSPGASITAYVAAWIGSFSAGLIAIMAPVGLGVREGVMRSMLETAGAPASSTVVVVVVARVWVTVLDVVPAALVLALRRRRNAASVLPPPAT